MRFLFYDLISIREYEKRMYESYSGFSKLKLAVD
jgi:hypothetical protein